MGNLAGLLLVAGAVGLSNFAAAIGIGMAGVDTWTRVKVGVLFGLFEAVMPLVGLLLGQSVRAHLGGAERFVAGGLLMVMGAYAFYEGRRPKTRITGVSLRWLVLAATALSVDNLVVGFALGVHHQNVILAALVIAGVSVGLSMLGLEIGDRLGSGLGDWSDEVGGAALIAIGLAIASGLMR